MNSENNPSSARFWKKCSTCKKEISFEALYYVCSVSTCRGKRLGLSFCSVLCWDAHLGFAGHRSAYAEEEKAPTLREFLQQAEPTDQASAASEENSQAESHAPRRILVRDQSSAKMESKSQAVLETDTLVVVSKVKKLIRDLSEFNTSQDAIDKLSEKVIELCQGAIVQARADGRKTVMGRDFP